MVHLTTLVHKNYVGAGNLVAPLLWGKHRLDHRLDLLSPVRGGAISQLAHEHKSSVFYQGFNSM